MSGWWQTGSKVRKVYKNYAKMHPCGVCSKWVGSSANANQCKSCYGWIHKRCSRNAGNLHNSIVNTAVYIVHGRKKSCKVWSVAANSTQTRPKLECIEKFCYLNDMIGPGKQPLQGRDVQEHILGSWLQSWQWEEHQWKRRERLTALVCRGCWYSNETWLVNVEYMQWLQTTEHYDGQMDEWYNSEGKHISIWPCSHLC